MTELVLAYDKSRWVGHTTDDHVLKSLVPHVAMVKIGLQLLSGHRDDAWRLNAFLRKQGVATLQDWKLHDIGNTVAETVANLVMNTSAVTVHASCSRHALRAVARVRDDALGADVTDNFELYGVTVLTDLTPDECMETYGDDPTEVVCGFAEKLIDARFDGIVCSGEELEALARREFTKHLKTLVPGTRPSWAPADDQHRTMSYEEVAELGATYTVVGRVVMQASDPLATLIRIREELGLPT